MPEAFSRSEMLIGAEALERLKESKVAIFGIGGVGSFAVEALARTGVGSFVLTDSDRVEESNINRQLHATCRTIGRLKVEVMKERIRSINPEAKVWTQPVFYTKENRTELLQGDVDYVIDAVDTVSAKIDLVVLCGEMGVPIVSCMGAGNKMDPTRFQVGDVYATSVDPLAKVMRRELRKRGIRHLKVVYSTEPPLSPKLSLTEQDAGQVMEPGESRSGTRRRAVPGSISFVPSVAGLILGGEVIRDLIGWKDNPQGDGEDRNE